MKTAVMASLAVLLSAITMQAADRQVAVSGSDANPADHDIPARFPRHGRGFPFVGRKGASLLLDGKPFRFSGVNIYWLCQDRVGGKIVYPSRFRIDDALDTAREMGENVVRAETFAESTGNPLSLEPA